MKSIGPATRAGLTASVIALTAACGAPSESTETAESTLRTACVARPGCDGDLPRLARGSFSHFTSRVTAWSSANHRVRDVLVRPGEPQWIIGKFAYGLADKDIHGEQVEIWIERGCGGSWERLGSSITTRDGEHPPAAGVEDSGGRVYFRVPAAQELPVGRHRVWMSVVGDRTGAAGIVEVVAPDARIFVSDVDGTLTESEDAELASVLTGSQPDAQPDAADLFTTLVARGYTPVYLTARAERLTERTREFLRVHGFPKGVIVTSQSHLGLRGRDAAAFKTNELARIRNAGSVEWAFGNTDTDSQAYATTLVAARQRVFLDFADPRGGRTIAGYASLASEVGALTAICP